MAGGCHGGCIASSIATGSPANRRASRASSLVVEKEVSEVDSYFGGAWVGALFLRRQHATTCAWRGGWRWSRASERAREASAVTGALLSGSSRYLGEINRPGFRRRAQIAL